LNKCKIIIVTVLWLVLNGLATRCMAGHFALAFQRKMPAWENSAGTGCLGGRVARVWVWDENGQPIARIKLRTTWNVLMGETDTDGRCQIAYNTGIGFDLVCDDEKGCTSDIAYLMTSELEPCRNFHSFEVGFLYKTSISNPGSFDTGLYGVWPQMNGYCDEAPYTRSLAYNSVDYRDYWSDQSYWGNWQNPPSYFGQTFVATGDRVVAARVQGTVGGNDTLDWKMRIVTFPGLQPVGPTISVPVRFPFGWEGFWGVNDCPVVPGQTYMLQVWRDNTGMNIFRVTKNVYSYGQYYEGTTAYPNFDLNGHICCMNYAFQRYADFNGDGDVDFKDFCEMAQHWGDDEPIFDIAPPPFGDGEIDFEDLAGLGEYWLQAFGVLAHWRLDETAGSVAEDSAGDKDGTVYGDLLWQPSGGVINGAIQLDGIDDYIATPFVLNPTSGPFTAFAWVKGGGPGQVVISQIASIILPSGRDWLCADGLQGRLMTALTDGSLLTSPLVSGFVITDGDWHRIGVAWDGFRRYLYADGDEVAKDVGTIANLVSSDRGFHLGAGRNRSAGTFWSGLIDDVRLYDRFVKP